VGGSSLLAQQSRAEPGALCYPLFGLTNRSILDGGNFWLWFPVVLAVLVIAYVFFDLR